MNDFLPSGFSNDYGFIMIDKFKNIIESLLFVSDAPLTPEKIRRALPNAETSEIKSVMKTLSEEYDTRGGGFFLLEVAGGYQLRSRPEYSEYIKKMLQPSPLRISPSAMETLAVIAYRQPLIRSDLEHIRGVDCGGVIKTLLDRKLIRIMGRKEIPGRPIIYGTTRHFLEVFNLKSLRDLPLPDEIGESSEASALVKSADEEKISVFDDEGEEFPHEVESADDALAINPFFENDNGEDKEIIGLPERADPEETRDLTDRGEFMPLESEQEKEAPLGGLIGSGSNLRADEGDDEEGEGIAGNA